MLFLDGIVTVIIIFLFLLRFIIFLFLIKKIFDKNRNIIKIKIIIYDID
jgi:hypothetical protein